MLALFPGPVEAAVPLLLLAHLGVVFSLQCYVCIPRGSTSNTDVTSVFPDFPSTLVCEDFHPNGQNQHFIRQCPEVYKSCLIETKGSEVTRTCAEASINDCKVANHVQYCYCNKELCNQEALPTSKDTPPDDEDEDVEGSGTGLHATTSNFKKTVMATTTTTTTTVSPHHKSEAAPSHHTAQLYLAALLLILTVLL